MTESDLSKEPKRWCYCLLCRHEGVGSETRSRDCEPLAGHATWRRTFIAHSRSSRVCEAEMQTRARADISGVAGKPTTTSATPRSQHSRDAAAILPGWNSITGCAHAAHTSEDPLKSCAPSAAAGPPHFEPRHGEVGMTPMCALCVVIGMKQVQHADGAVRG